MNTPALRIGFAGTPDFAASHLDALLNAKYNILGVYTQPDRPAGRGKKDKPSPVKTLSLKSNLPIFQPQSLKNEEAQEQLQKLNLDVLVVVAYGLILPQEILDMPRYGCINVHASLLPRWRGAAPIERAILAGDKITGVTIMQMDAGLDTGDILLSSETPIDANDNSASLTARLKSIGQDALLDVLKEIQSNSIKCLKQNNDISTYASKLSKEEALISWDKSAEEILRQVNAFYPRSPAYCFYHGQRLRIIQASALTKNSAGSTGTIGQISHNGIEINCADSSLLVNRIQLPGKAEISIKDFLNGRKDYFSQDKSFSSSPQQDQ
ncbi:MAG: methionyl-tRNA formyltransferase [Gammaproteobacteria bacterium]|jgi:methionyl-tRNA formyltransferase|nr:methionyl-tRNA formyltransferase [Gammaproteobacteria bacterium]